MAVDFTPILTLIITVIPILLLVAILARFTRGKLWTWLILAVFLSLLLSPVLGLGFLGIGRVSAAAQLTPSTGTLMTDLPNWFSATGLTASTAHHVNVTVAGSETNAISSVTSNSDGEISFSLTFTVTGSTQVDVAEGAQGAGTSKCTGNFNVVSLINTIMPYIVLMITLGILFGLVGVITKMIPSGS